MKPTVTTSGNSLMVLDHTRGWVMPIRELPNGRGPISCGAVVRQRISPSRSVVDERQQMAGGGDAADVATPSDGRGL